MVPVINGVSHNAVEPVASGATFEVTIDAEGTTDRIFTAVVTNPLTTENATADLTLQFNAPLTYALNPPVGSGIQVAPKAGSPKVFVVTVP